MLKRNPSIDNTLSPMLDYYGYRLLIIDLAVGTNEFNKKTRGEEAPRLDSEAL